MAKSKSNAKLKQAWSYWDSFITVAAPLLMRLTVGWVFMTSGWGKLHNLASVTEFFQSLGIPLAAVQAPMVSFIEFAGGLMLILGLYTRLVSIPLIAIMKVAIITAKPEVLKDLSDLLDASEFLYIAILAGLAAFGAGKASLDYVWRKKPWMIPRSAK